MPNSLNHNSILQCIVTKSQRNMYILWTIFRASAGSCFDLIPPILAILTLSLHCLSKTVWLFTLQLHLMYKVGIFGKSDISLLLRIENFHNLIQSPWLKETFPWNIWSSFFNVLNIFYNFVPIPTYPWCGPKNKHSNET